MFWSRQSIFVRSVSVLDKLILWIKNHLPTQRRLIQLYAALLYNAHAKGFITGNIYTGATKILCVPGLNCYSCPGAVGACPLGALQNAVASSRNRTPVYVLGILMLYGLILGRTICGYICPVGLVQELLHKLPTPKIKKSRITHILSYFKYILFAVLVVAVPLWFAFQSLPLPAFCKFVCPAGTLEGAVGLLSHPENADKFSMLGVLFTWKMIVALLLVGLCVFLYRGFCRFICPLGAFYGIFSRIALIGVRVDCTRCTGCGKCVRECPMDIQHVGDHECVSCGKCVSVCPTKAIELRAGKFVLTPTEKSTAHRALPLIGWLLALSLLAGVTIYVNRADKDETPPPAPPVEDTVDSNQSEGADNTGDTTSDPVPDIGNEIGMTAPDFTVALYGGGEFTLSQHKGKIVVVNFWATWCTPCCAELPHFNAVYEALGESVTVVAIHSDLVTDDVEAYLAGYNYSLPFALDETGNVGKLLGVSTMLPHTIVIDANGIVTYNCAGSLNHEELLALINQAAGKTE